MLEARRRRRQRRLHALKGVVTRVANRPSGSRDDGETVAGQSWSADAPLRDIGCVALGAEWSRIAADGFDPLAW